MAGSRSFPRFATLKPLEQRQARAKLLNKCFDYWGECLNTAVEEG